MCCRWRAAAMRAALAERPLVPARRALLPDPGRFAAGLSPAAGLAALGDARATIRGCIRPIPTQSLPRRCPAHPRIRHAMRRRCAARRTACRRGRRPEPAQRRARARAASAAAPDARVPTHAPRRSSSPPAGLRAPRMCAEPRDGRLYVFMPPTAKLEDYLELVAAVEATAEALQLPVLLEGYEPPRDPRLHAAARHARSGRDRSQHPAGAQLGRAGRAHRVPLRSRAPDRDCPPRSSCSTAATPAPAAAITSCSAARRRRIRPSCAGPICSRSLIAYWHNHPSLSYLFSGLFIGPTSQAPRVDEARNDSLYELEIAFANCSACSGRAAWHAAPWLVDRMLRNLLIDVTGNTHRAEFCIDKLYSPDGATGRLGLLELRAFEMPPHARMSLAQQLLLRALVARFWQQPYQPARLVRWGTELHDRFHAAAFRLGRFRRCDRGDRRRGYALEPDVVRAAFRIPFPAYWATSPRAASRSNCARRSSPGTCWARKARPAAPCATSIPRWSACRCKVRGLVDDAPRAHLQWLPRAAAAHRHRRRIRRPACATAPGSRRPPASDDRRARAADLRPGRHAGSDRSLGGCTLPRRASRRPQLRDLPGQCLRGRGRRLARFFRIGHTPGAMKAVPRATQPGVSVHARPASHCDRAAPSALQAPSLGRWARCDHTVTEQSTFAMPRILLKNSRSPDRAASTSCSPRRASRARTGGPSSALAARQGRQIGDIAGLTERADPRERRHLQRLCRSARGRPTVGSGCAAAASIPPDEWARDRSRHRPARHAAQSRAGRPLRRAAHCCARACFRRRWSSAQRLPASGAAACACPAACTCTSTPPISRARPMAAGG